MSKTKYKLKELMTPLGMSSPRRMAEYPDRVNRPTKPRKGPNFQKPRKKHK